MTFRADRYPADWSTRIVPAIRKRAFDRCECTGECGSKHKGRCAARNGAIIVRRRTAPAEWIEHAGCSLCLGGDPECKPVRVVLTVAHLDHDESNNDPANLRAMCQRCHLQLDRADNARRRRETKQRDRAAGELPGPEGGGS